MVNESSQLTFIEEFAYLFWLAYNLKSGQLKIYTVKPVLNGISRDQNIFPLKPGFRLIKVHYIQYKKLNQDMQTLN